MAATGPSLADAAGLALEQWRLGEQHRPRLRLGAAGQRGGLLQDEIKSLALPASIFAQETFTPNPISRLLGTAIGRHSTSTVGSDEQTLRAMELLSLEAMAAALEHTGQTDKNDRLLAMPAQDGRPPLLMLMSPEVTSVADSRVVSDELHLPLSALLEGLKALAPDENTPEATAWKQVADGGESAVAQLFLIAQPEIVRTRRPRMIPLCAPSPHMRVDAGTMISTVGIFCRDAAGKLGLTACYHGTGATGTVVTINKRQYQVKDGDPVQDIVFIPLDDAFPVPSLVGRGGVLDNREPARADHAHFDGAVNHNRQTRIFGADAGLLRSRPTIMLKVQTDPDTDQGDSGCALIDDSDHVLGFAFERTAYNDYPQFTDWIWAANALNALRLTPY